MGLALGGLACARRGWWVWAGVLLGLAVTSQQFALLVVAPLVVLAPRNRRSRFVGAAIGAAALVVVPLIAITSGQVIKALVGAAATPPSGRTVLSAMHLHGPMLFSLSRILPIVLAMVLAWWMGRRLGKAALDPVPLVSLIATSLALRLVLEVNLFGYYFMAATLSLVVLAIIRGRFSVCLVAWIALVTLAFNPLSWGNNPWSSPLPIWVWQILLVPVAVALAAGPLTSSAHDRRGSTPRVTEEHRVAL